MSDTQIPQQNRLLEALPAIERERILPHLQLVPMPLGKVLNESGGALRHVYFPIDCIVSLLYVTQDGATAEISMVGNEGIVGIALFMGGERSVLRSARHRSSTAVTGGGEGVTEAAGKLQKLGAIQYSRGHITGLDRLKLD